MKKIICDKLSRILKNKQRLEKALKVKITNRGTEIYIDGEAEAEYIAEKVIEALNFGFPYSTALLLRDGENLFEILNIKDYTTRKDLARIRARIIGTKGKTLKTLCQLTKCYFELKDNFIGIIGDPEYIKNAQDSIIHLIKGAKQANVYAYLEKHQPKPELDLGLKDRFKY
jgi:ribosomal RNA assembly protein